jgi:hypothetical protein
MQAISLDVIEKVASVVESVAVLASLIYVAIQFRMNTKAIKGATYQNIVSSIAHIEARISEDKELARIFRVGCAGEPLLDPDEQIRFDHLISSLFNFGENMFYQYEHGLIDEDTWTTWHQSLIKYFEDPGVMKWWEVGGPAFRESFRKQLGR